MTFAPDEFRFERSRAAVAVACLQWLRCTGRSTGPGSLRVGPPDVADFPRQGPPIVNPIYDPGPAHPLWDRWLDG